MVYNRACKGGDAVSCMRCGKETEVDQVFCDECLTDMERHPVKPGTPIQLPQRETRTVVKRSSFKLAASKWQDKIFRLKYTIFWLSMIIILLTAALVLALGMLLQITPAWVNEFFFEQPVVQSIIRNVTP